jgi:Flp pilus assembly protein TadG
VRQHCSARVRGGSRALADERGTVTAETVMVLPALVAVTLALAWLVALGATQVRVVDAAREVARAAARDDSTAGAVGLGRQVAPRGATISVQRRGGQVVAHVRAEVRGPGGLLTFLPAVHVEADAVAASEP